MRHAKHNSRTLVILGTVCTMERFRNMRVARPVLLNAEQRQALEQRARARSLPARLVERSRIVLLAADGN